MTHPGLLNLQPVTRRAARGPRSSGSEAANTDRRARKATRGDPQVKVPAPGLLTGSYPKDARRHGQPAPIVAAPPAPHRPNSPGGTARAEQPGRPSRAAHRATERQRPAPAGNPQPPAQFSGQRDRPRRPGLFDAESTWKRKLVRS